MPKPHSDQTFFEAIRCPLCHEPIQANRLRLHIEHYCGLREHSRNDTKTVQCPYCQCFFERRVFRTHIIDGCHHQSSTPPRRDPMITCPDCGVSLLPMHLVKHQRKCPAHGAPHDTPSPTPERDETLYRICPDCQAKVRRNHFDKHRHYRCPQRVHQRIDASSSADPLQSCPECGVIMSVHRLETHQRQHRLRIRSGQGGDIVTLPPTPAIAGDTRPRTKEGYVIETCSSCRRRVCLVEGPTTWYEFNIVANMRGDRHVCDGESVPYREFIFGTRHANYDRKNRKKR